MASHILGIDVGGSGIKGAPVDVETGEFTEKRHRIETPDNSTPENVRDVIAKIADHFADDIGTTSPIGITIPGPVRHGVVPMMANLDDSWVGLDAEKFFTAGLGRPVTVLNDADAAGVAEIHHGAGRNVDGVVILTTLGTGIGTAIFNDGVLLPNTEIGHIEIDGHDAETRASAKVRKREDLSFAEWAERLQRYYETVEMLFWPDLFIVGGGVSKKADEYLPLININTPIIPAVLENQAGIVGAAMLAHERNVI